MSGMIKDDLLIPFLSVELGIPASVLWEEDTCDIMAMVYYMRAKARKAERESGTKKLYNDNFI